jgi:hypothetical protein
MGLLIPEVSEELFLIRVILADPLQTSLHEALDVLLVESQAKIEDLRVVTMVVTDGCPAREALFPSPTA